MITYIPIKDKEYEHLETNVKWSSIGFHVPLDLLKEWLLHIKQHYLVTKKELEAYIDVVHASMKLDIIKTFKDRYPSLVLNAKTVDIDFKYKLGEDLEGIKFLFNLNPTKITLTWLRKSRKLHRVAIPTGYVEDVKTMLQLLSDIEDYKTFFPSEEHINQYEYMTLLTNQNNYHLMVVNRMIEIAEVLYLVQQYGKTHRTYNAVTDLFAGDKRGEFPTKVKLLCIELNNFMAEYPVSEEFEFSREPNPEDYNYLSLK